MKDLDKIMLDKVDKVINSSFTFETLKSLIQEGSSGTPIVVTSTLPSKDRTDLEHLFYKIKDSIDPKKYVMDFLQNKIVIQLARGLPGYDDTPNQNQIMTEELNTSELLKQLDGILMFMIEKGANVEPLPKVRFVQDETEANSFFGKTAYYSPEDQVITLFTLNRHPKDIGRSFTHEMIHHIQNIEGRIGKGTITTTNTNEDEYLQELEDEAYLMGNRYFRNYTDSVNQR
ncbi:MAG TPA: hypothetical protein PKC87_01055 [Candidatus Absconditabacterales bacterium]|nr:hypothetical protein [Candidatus Absconditabacterales bacterium]